jgi:hypothetical protein
MTPDIGQLDEAIDCAEEMTGGDMILKAEPDEKCLLPNGPLAHHPHALVATRTEPTCRRDS